MRNIRLGSVAAIVLLLAACGGGGGGGNDDGGGDPPSKPDSGAHDPSSNKNHRPTADAGQQQNVKVDAKVRLDGGRSRDADGDRLSYDWTFSSRPSGSGAKLRNAHGPAPLFTADAAGSYVAKLVVNDGSAYSKADTVKVVASPAKANSVPVADAGRPQSVKTSSVVHLDGSDSTDADGNALTYQWRFASRPTGSNAKLTDADTATPSFTADAAGDYVISLVVNDGQADSAPARVTIHAAAANAAPVADAGGDRSAGVGDTVTLDGSASSDADDDSLSYDWRLVSVPKGSGASLNNAHKPMPSFVADAEGPYVAKVTVSDDNGGKDSDRAVITVVPTLKLLADLDNSGSYEKAQLPYDETEGQTVFGPPNTPSHPKNGFVLGRFKVTAVGGDITLNLTGSLKRLNDSTGAYSPVFDGFQGYNTAARQVVIPQGKTVPFSVNVGVPPHSKAMVTYTFTAVETGDTFEATYTVESNDN